jgi:hypothetical protein
MMGGEKVAAHAIFLPEDLIAAEAMVLEALEVMGQ